MAKGGAYNQTVNQELRNQRISEVTPEIIKKACVRESVKEMYESILQHSGYACAKMYIWISYFGRGKAELTHAKRNKK